eukprot:COSAG01_NODE_9970_length_2288_cov_11.761207_6_plen_30_part_01
MRPRHRAVLGSKRGGGGGTEGESKHGGTEG